MQKLLSSRFEYREADKQLETDEFFQEIFKKIKDKNYTV